MFMFDFLFGIHYICYITQNLGKYKYIIDFYDHKILQRYLKRQFSYYFRRRKYNYNKTSNNNYFTLSYESIDKLFTDDIIERLEGCYFFYSQKYQAKKELIKYLHINLCEIVLHYLYHVNETEEIHLRETSEMEYDQ